MTIHFKLPYTNNRYIILTKGGTRGIFNPGAAFIFNMPTNITKPKYKLLFICFSQANEDY